MSYVGGNSSSERATGNLKPSVPHSSKPTRDIFTCHGWPLREAREARMHSFMNKYLLSVYLRQHNSEQARPSFNEVGGFSGGDGPPIKTEFVSPVGVCLSKL